MSQFKLTIGAKQCIVVHENNIHKCSIMILNAFKDIIPIKSNAHSIKQMKKYQTVTNAIALELITHGNLCCVDSLLPHNTTHLRNWNIMLKLLWCNRLIMKDWVRDSAKYQLLFYVAHFSVVHDDIMSKSRIETYTNLFETLLQSAIYWDITHVEFMIKFGLNKSIAKLFYAYVTCTHEIQNKSQYILKLLTYFTAHVYRITLNNLLVFIQWMKPINRVIERIECSIKWQTSKKAKYSRQKRCQMIKICMRFHTNFREIKIDVDDYLQKGNFIKITKECGNTQCVKSNRKSKIKICKACKSVYYCGKRCQKRHWKSIHRLQCNEIQLKIRIMNRISLEIEDGIVSTNLGTTYN
jgi:hypothetical protein